MTLVSKGAEANLFLDSGGRLVKQRILKKYRIPELDERLRKSRTRGESKILGKLFDAGLNVPKVYDMDLREYSIVMDFIDGVLLKKFFEESGEEDVARLCLEVGSFIARLHSMNIIHGDLTTSNMILNKERRIFFIDFGLGFTSTRVEDKAVDLVVLRKAVKATHTKRFDLIWNSIAEGYTRGCDKWPEILKRIDVIESRVRYA